MSALLRIAWRNLWRHRRRSLITATAMAVGVALCLALVAFTDGTYVMMFDVLVERNIGHVEVHHPDYPTGHAPTSTIRDADAALAKLDGLADTRAATARLRGYALVGGEARSEGALLIGVLPQREAGVSGLGEKLVEGAWLPAEAAQGIVLGAGLAETLGVGVGAEVVAVTQAADGSLGNALYTVTGVVRSGQTAMDKGGAWIHLRDAQDLLVLPDQVHELTALATTREGIGPYADEVRAAMGEGRLVRPWWEIAPQLQQMLGMQDAFSFIMLGVVFAVAGLGVVNTMLMSVFERTRELGVMMALGLRPTRIVGLVVLESLLLAGLSLAIGLVLGAGLDAWICGPGIDFSDSMKDGYDAMGMTVDPVLKGSFRIAPVVWTVGSVLLVAVLAALWPALRAARLHPVDAIRTE